MRDRLDDLEWRADCLQSRMDALVKRDADDPCWKGYEQAGTKEKDGRTVPNCVKADMEPLTRGDGVDETNKLCNKGSSERGDAMVAADEGMGEKFYIVTYDRDGTSKRPKFTKGEATKSGESHLRTSPWKGARYEVVNIKTGQIVAQGQK